MELNFKGIKTMKQIISKNGRVLCTTTVPYSKETIKQMKSSGHKVKEEDTDEGGS